jgi:hypothetical protein
MVTPTARDAAVNVVYLVRRSTSSPGECRGGLENRAAPNHDTWFGTTAVPARIGAPVYR